MSARAADDETRFNTSYKDARRRIGAKTTDSFPNKR